MGPRDTAVTDSVRAERILSVLTAEYGEVRGFLDHENAFQLLIEVILSAQTTDRQVNLVAPELFRRFPTPKALGAAPLSSIERVIHPTGFFHAKARNVRAAAARLAEEFDSQVPESMEELTSLPGVGRKTANVVRGALFGRPAIIVDTHFGRVVRRLGFTTETDPEKVERELAGIVAPRLQYRFSMSINQHGRSCCRARRPDCPRCPISRWCPYPDKTGGSA